jgi:hypothetical protein
MPVSKLPSDYELLKMRHRGLNDEQIAAQFGATKQAVNKRLVKHERVRPVSTRVNEFLRYRWEIFQTQGTDSHHNRYSAKRLKEWLRWRLGDQTLSEDQLRRARVWEERLRREDIVLCYDRDQPEPWYYRAREKRDGRLVIDWPEELPFPDDKLRTALELPPAPDAKTA